LSAKVYDLDEYRRSRTVSADTEPEPEAAWRIARFLGLGFDVVSAAKLNAANADWHKVDESLADGCTLELAVEIFA
jgi:hypothetical protein